MTETVKRYIIHYDGRGEEEHPNGDFVHWGDIQKLIQRNKELEDANVENLRRVRETRDESLKIERTMKEALEEVAELKGLLKECKAELKREDYRVDRRSLILSKVEERLK